MYKSYESAAMHLMTSGYGFHAEGLFKNGFDKLMKVVKAASGYYVVKEA